MREAVRLLAADMRERLAPAAKGEPLPDLNREWRCLNMLSCYAEGSLDPEDWGVSEWVERLPEGLRQQVQAALGEV